MLADYRSHDSETLDYMDTALYQIDKLKGVFAKYRPSNRRNRESGRFNFPKFHAITHYPDYIRLYGTPDGVDTTTSETAHKNIVKVSYNLTNKRLDHEEQMIPLTVHRVSCQTMRDMMQHRKECINSQALIDARIEAMVTRASSAINLVQYNFKPIKSKLAQTKIRFWKLRDKLQLDSLQEALAVFIREMRIKHDDQHTPANRLDRLDPDSSWVGNLIVQIHASITCFKADGHEPAEEDRLKPEKVRCSPEWQGQKGDWRKDCVWVQENEELENSRNVTMGRRVGRLELILTIEDPERRLAGVNNSGPKPVTYTGAFITVFRLRNPTGLPNEIHGMLEVEEPTPGQTDAGRKRNLTNRRFYSLEHVIRSAHVIPKYHLQKQEQQPVYYINNYIDWDQYNTIYHPNFRSLARKQAATWERKLRAAQPSSEDQH
ncbi:hypothetical protein GX50_09023 [[Emmonsia] crescens]|uniref:Uncharacterized protein n=1 Tax=[Emmonsia] crescens TaxID=73230 RepID=A0A2B7XY27_9EURO|nr:hypothetical protein GX50_09023 [Emmonsia crescens]